MHLVSDMAFGAPPHCHGLGNPLQPNQPLDVWAKQAGMNWSINEAEVRFVCGTAGAQLGSIQSYPEQKVLYRSDTQISLSVVSRRFQVVQPTEIIEFFTAISLRSAGSNWRLRESSRKGVNSGHWLVPARAPC